MYYTVSGIITPIGGRPVHRLKEDWMLNLCIKLFNTKINILRCTVSKTYKKKIAASSMLHEAKIAYYAFDAAILFATTIGPAVAKAT